MRAALRSPTLKNLIAVVQDDYRIKVKSSSFIPGGEVAFAYQLKVEGGPDRFLKIYGDSRQAQNATENLNSSLGFTVALAEQNTAWIVPPSPTVRGSFIGSVDAFKFVLFPLIVSVLPETAPSSTRIRLGGIVAELHGLPVSDYEKTLRHIQPDIRFLDELELMLADMPEIFAGSRAALQKRAVSLREIHLALGRGSDKVVTHGDIYNYLISPEGRVYLVDWDTVGIGWRERDLWRFFQRRNGLALRGYRRASPLVHASPDRCRFLLLEKLLRNIFNWSWRIRHEDYGREQLSLDLNTMQDLLEEERHLDAVWKKMEIEIGKFNHGA